MVETSMSQNKAESEELTLVFELSLAGVPLGSPLEVDANHPITGGLRQILSEGKPGLVTHLLGLDTGEGRRLLGTLSHTVGDRLLFSPATHVKVFTGDPSSRFESAELDHITLDPPSKTSRHSSHIAVRNLPTAKSRGVGWTTVPPAAHKVPWFSLLLPTVELLPLLPDSLVVHLPRIWTDVDAYAEKVIGSIGTVERLVLPEPLVAPAFAQFDFWAGRGLGWTQEKHRLLAWAYKTEIIRDAPLGSSTSPCPRPLSRSPTAWE